MSFEIGFSFVRVRRILLYVQNTMEQISNLLFHVECSQRYKNFHKQSIRKWFERVSGSMRDMISWKLWANLRGTGCMFPEHVKQDLFYLGKLPVRLEKQNREESLGKVFQDSQVCVKPPGMDIQSWIAVRTCFCFAWTSWQLPCSGKVEVSSNKVPISHI